MSALRIGTRGSALALWQARRVAALLEGAGHAATLAIIRTTGDRLAEATLADAGGKRLFVKEIEDALLDARVDVAVHSAKDLPVDLPDGLVVAAALPREDPRDAIVLPAGSAPLAGLDDLARLAARGCRMGTSSVRRVAQLAPHLPGASFLPVRGNLDTRLRKLDDRGYDALVLAAAGLVRLGLDGRIAWRVPADVCLPSPGQGIIAVEIRARDGRAAEAVGALDDAAARAALDCERALIVALGGGCQLPVGALAREDAGDLVLEAVVASPDGSRIVRQASRRPSTEAGTLGAAVGAGLLAAGADAILDDVRRAQA